MKEIQILNNGDTLHDIRTKINENFELMEKGTSDPLAKFGVNEGNETDGVADLLNIEEGTLSFKVGGEYPNLVMTSGDGVTTQIESVDPLHLQNLADGEYTVVVDGSNSNITDAEFYSQLLEPENPNNGDVWFNGETASYLNSGERSVKTISNGSINFTCMDSIGDLVVVGGQSNKIFVSNDNMKTWSLIDVTTDSVNYSVIGCTAYNNKIYIVGNDGSVRYIDASLQIWQAPSMLAAIQPTRLRKVNNKFVALGATGNIAYTDNMEAWTTQLIASPSVMLDITYRDGTYFVLNGNGGIFISQTLTSWTAIQPQALGGKCLKLYGDDILIGCQNGVLKIMNKQNVIATEKTMDIKGEIKDMAILEDGSLLIVGNQNLCYTTSDLENFSLIQVIGGDLRHIHKDYMVGANGYILQLVTAKNWIPYPYIPVGEVTISGGEVTYFTTYPYNTNGLHEASSSSFGLLRTAAVVDELNCHCSDAVLTPANLYSLNNYRTMNTEYKLGDKVGCPYHHNLQLKCIQEGTTSNEGLNTRGLLESGNTIEDGTVIWEVEELGTGAAGGGSGFNLFDTKISDYVLQGKEANGWALQGTYVTKDKYPNFYNKCLEEYQNSEAQISTEPWTQPVATGEITAIDGGDMVITSSEGVEESYYPYLAFDGDYSSSSSMWSAYPNTEAWWQIKFPYKIKVTGLTFYQKTSGAGHYTKDARFYTSSDMNTPIGDAFVGTGSNFAVTEIQNIPAEGIITDTIYLNITSSHNGGVGMGDLKITAEKITDEIRNNPNGHKFYPISLKPAIDTIYNQCGIADFYGIDEENERIFLPRNKYFALTGGVMGNGMVLGLNRNAISNTNLFSQLGASASGNSDYVDVIATNENIKAGYPIGVNTDPTKSGIVLEANESKYLYYCVGNTEVTQAITNVTEVTTSENDTIPLFTGMYFDFKPNNVSWLKAGEQQNSAGIYQSCYDTLVEIVNGVNNYDLKVVNQADIVSGVNYDEYWILDQDNLTFRTPLTISLKTYDTVAPVIGNGITIGLTDGTTNYGMQANGYTPNYNVNPMQAYTKSYGKAVGTGTSLSNSNGVNTTLGLTTDPNNSGIEAHLVENTTAQLYFKVANAVQNLELLDVGRVMEEAVLRSSLVEAQVVVETYQNGTSWCRVWSDGWCEQGGIVARDTGTSGTIALLKEYANTNYTVVSNTGNNAANNFFNLGAYQKTTTSIPWWKSAAGIQGDWVAKGYIK